MTHGGTPIQGRRFCAWAADAEVTLKLPLVTLVKPLALPTIVKPVPALSTLRSENVATPLVAAMVVVPNRVAPEGLLPRDTVMAPEKFGSGLPVESTAATDTDGIVWPAGVEDG